MSDMMNGLENFGYQEIDQAIELLAAYRDSDKPENWTDTSVRLDFNSNSGVVFLTNCDYQALVMDAEYGLCRHHSTPYSGKEGVLPELCQNYLNDPDSWDSAEDQEYLWQATFDEESFFKGREDSKEIIDLLITVREAIILKLVESNIDDVLQAIKDDHPNLGKQLEDGEVLDEIYAEYGAGLFDGFEDADSMVSSDTMREWFAEQLEKSFTPKPKAKKS